MQVSRFVVNETPYAFWDHDLNEKNLEFLRGIDANYFRYIVETNVPNLDRDDKDRAALSLRIAYSQGLETLFALLCSYVQAPTCVVGWMLSYKVSELRSVVQKISDGQDLYTRLKDHPVSWELLSEQVHSGLKFDKGKIEWIQNGFARLWSRFAREFVDQRLAAEYNSTKHGLRTQLGGFSLSVGVEKVPGVPASPDAMHAIGGSLFGTSYFTPEAPVAGDRVNLRPRRNARNWSPQNLGNGLILLSMSIGNVCSYLQIVNGANPEECKFTTPTHDAFGEPWRNPVAVEQVNLDTVVAPQDIVPSSREEVIKSYTANEQG